MQKKMSTNKTIENSNKHILNHTTTNWLNNYTTVQQSNIHLNDGLDKFFWWLPTLPAATAQLGVSSQLVSS